MPRQVEPSRRKKILDMYQEGASLTAIARETGAARATIRNVLAAADLTDADLTNAGNHTEWPWPEGVK